MQRKPRNVLLYVRSKHPAHSGDLPALTKTFEDTAKTYLVRKDVYSSPSNDSVEYGEEIVSRSSEVTNGEELGCRTGSEIFDDCENPEYSYRTLPSPRTVKNMSRNLRFVQSTRSIQSGTVVQVLEIRSIQWVRGIPPSSTESRNTLRVKTKPGREIKSSKSSHWRYIQKHEPCPLLDTCFNAELAHRYESAMSFAREAKDWSRLIPDCTGQIRASDFCSHEQGKMLTDDMLASFAHWKNNISRSSGDKRLLFVSPQAIVKVQYKNSSMSRWISDVQIHDIDTCYRPIHWRQSVHWTLCVGFPGFKRATIIDPLIQIHRPGHRILHLSQVVVILGFNQLSYSYDQRFHIERSWNLFLREGSLKKPTSADSRVGMAQIAVFSYVSTCGHFLWDNRCNPYLRRKKLGNLQC